MIPIISIGIRADYNRSRDAYKQQLFAEIQEYLDERFNALECAVENELALANLDENTYTSLLKHVNNALVAHSADDNRLTERVMGVIDKIVLKKTEVKK